MNELLYSYFMGVLVFANISFLCAVLTNADPEEGIKVGLLAGLLWPILLIICVHAVIIKLVEKRKHRSDD